MTEAIEELTRRRRALVQAGFDHEAEEMSRQLTRLREATEAKRREEGQRLYKQKLWALQLSQKHEGARRPAHAHTASLPTANSCPRVSLLSQRTS